MTNTMTEAEAADVVHRAEEYVKNPYHRHYLPTNRAEPMTVERFEAIHGKSVQVSANRRMCADGAWWTSDSILGPVFREPSANPVELLMDRVSHWKVRRKQADDALFHFKNERYRMMNAHGQLLTLGSVKWNAEELGRPAPLDKDGKFDIDAGLEWLAFLVRLRSNKLRKLEAQLRQLRPDLLSV